DDVVPSLQEGPGPRRPLERKAAAHGRAGGDALDPSRRSHELDDPAEEQLIDVDVLDRDAKGLDIVRIDARLQVGDGMSVALRDDDLDLLVSIRVAEDGPEREPVELGFGKRERAFLLDRV